MNSTIANALLVLFFLLIGAVFAGSEIALVSLREGQVRRSPQRGIAAQRVAALHADPNRFLAAVQIGVTLAGFSSAAFGASAFADDLAPVLEGWGMPEGAAVLGRVHRRSRWSSPTCPWSSASSRPSASRCSGPRRSRCCVAPTLDRLARDLAAGHLAAVEVDRRHRPALRWRPDGVAARRSRRRSCATSSPRTRRLGREERKLIEDVFEAGERQLHEVMVPRTEVEFLDASHAGVQGGPARRRPTRTRATR